LSTITDPVRVRTHPGEVLREEFMAPLGVSRNRLSREAACLCLRCRPLRRAGGR